MKKFYVVLIIVGISIMATSAFADTEERYAFSLLARDTNKDDAFTKLGRGFGNIFTAPGEIFAQPVLLTQQYDPVMALFGGFFKGISLFVQREIAGFYDVFTFPFPSKYPARIDPPTTFTDWDLRRPSDSF